MYLGARGRGRVETVSQAGANCTARHRAIHEVIPVLRALPSPPVLMILTPMNTVMLVLLSPVNSN